MCLSPPPDSPQFCVADILIVTGIFGKQRRWPWITCFHPVSNLRYPDPVKHIVSYPNSNTSFSKKSGLVVILRLFYIFQTSLLELIIIINKNYSSVNIVNFLNCWLHGRFTSDVKIKSISVVGGAGGTSPSKMRAYVWPWHDFPDVVMQLFFILVGVWASCHDVSHVVMQMQLFFIGVNVWSCKWHCKSGYHSATVLHWFHNCLSQT